MRSEGDRHGVRGEGDRVGVRCEDEGRVDRKKIFSFYIYVFPRFKSVSQILDTSAYYV